MNDIISPEPMRVNFRWYLPLAASWVLSQERIILQKGVPLTAAELADARFAGVKYPRQVRLLRVEQVPLPAQPELRAMAEGMQLTARPVRGLTLRYGIYICGEHWGQRELVVHKLVHTAQYERLGSVSTFLECYLYQCLAVGNTAAPLEQEAMTMAQQICGQARAPDRTPAVLQDVAKDTPFLRSKARR
jgi:hypothetical protein